jgi:hypothetical protein
MKSKTSKPKTTPEEQRFTQFAKALMAVPKKELDKEIAKDERKKQSRRQKS